MRILMTLCALVVAAPALADDKPAPTKPRAVTVKVGQTVPVQMTSKRPIKSVVNDNPTVVSVAPDPENPARVFLTGLAPGSARLVLTDVDGRKETHDLGKPSGK